MESVKDDKQLLAGIIDHNGSKVAFDGLLGMNFLKHFQFYIDQNDANLRLQALMN